MYLSKTTMSVLCASGRKAMTNAHELHRNIQSMFPAKGGARQDLNILYSTVMTRDHVYVYVMSDVAPDDSHSESMTVLETHDMSWIREAAGKKGAVFSFRMTAAPSRKQKREGKKNSARLFLRNREDQLAWLDKRLEEAGVEKIQTDARKSERIFGEKVVRTRADGRQEKERISYETVLYTGSFLIHDPEKFIAAWQKGFGPGKAYGLGMMLLAA